MRGARHVWAAHETPPLAGAHGGKPESGFSEADLARSILVVEDEVLIAWMIESLLEEVGFSSIRLATSATDALASATDHAPEILVSDINLGAGDNGIDAAIRIRRIVAIPVIFVSAYVDKPARQRISEDIGNAIVLRKPVEAKALLNALREVLDAPSRH